MRTEMKKCASAALMSSLKNRKATIPCFWKKKLICCIDEHFLSHLHCLSNTMQGEFAEFKQRWDVWGLRAAEIKYDRAWIWWMTQLCHVQGLRREGRLASLGPLFLATLGFSWTFLRATRCKFKLLFRREHWGYLHVSYQHRGDVWTHTQTDTWAKRNGTEGRLLQGPCEAGWVFWETAVSWEGKWKLSCYWQAPKCLVLWAETGRVEVSAS